jgi:HPr kinase/phosphorylase
MPPHLLHASCVAIEGQGVLLTGDSGVGKSDLALRLIDRGAKLVADDQTELRVENGKLIASPPPSIGGLIEVRHIGLLRMPFCSSISIDLCVELVPDSLKLDRLPEPDRLFLLDQPVRRLRLHAHEASVTAKIRAALLYTAIE